MAITAATRTDIIELVVLATGGAPGVTLLSDLVAAVEGGSSLKDVATTLTNSAAFKSVYPSFATPGEFAEEFLGNIAPGLSSAAKAEAVAVVTGLLNSGATKADILVEAAAFLGNLAPTDVNFGSSAALFQNQVAVANYHTVVLELDTNLTTALVGVTSDPASVTTANASLGGNTSAANTAAANAIAAAEAAIATATADDAAYNTALADYNTAAATAALTDAAALKVVSDAANAAAAAAVTAKAAADAEVVTAQTALTAAIAGGDPTAVSTANGTLIIKQAAAATAATNVTTTAEAAATAQAATDAADAADAAAAAAATALATATTAALASGAADDAAAAAAVTAAAAAVAAAAATSTPSDDVVAASYGPIAAGLVTTAAATGNETAASVAYQNALTAYNTADAAAAAALATAQADAAAAATAKAAVNSLATANAYVTAAATSTASAATAASTAATAKTAADALVTAAAATAATTDDASAAAAATASGTRVTTANGLVSTAASDTTASAANLPTYQAKSFTLTADIDSGTAFTGGSGNDTFIADETTTAKVSLADVLTGGLGTDSLTIYNSKGVAPQMSAIESLTLNTIADSVNFNASNATGLTSLNVISAGGTNTFTVGSGVAVSIANTAIDAGADGAADVAVVYDANATSATLTLNKVSSAGADSALGITGAKLTTLNVATTGAASTVQELEIGANAAGNSSKIDTLVITGDQNLTITEGVALAKNATAGTSTITSTGLTGALNLGAAGTGGVTVAAGAALTVNAGNGVNTVVFNDVDVNGSITATFGSGKDVITLTDATGSVSINTGDGADKVTVSELDSKYNSTDKETASINLGAGDDTLTIANALTAANLASGVTLAGGDGTDTLNIDNDEYLTLFDNSTADVTVSGFEKLALQNGDSGTFDLSKVSGGTMTTVVLGEGVNTGGALVVSNAAAGLTLDWALKDANTTAGGAIDVSLKDASGSADAVTLNVTLTDNNDAVDSLVIADFEVKKDSNSKAVETLNIAVDGTLTATTAATVKTAASQYAQITSLDLSGGVTTVNISGDGSTKINGYANASTLVTVNAANSSGANNLSVAAGTTFIGGTGADTFTGTQAQFAALTSLTGGTGTDTVAITNTAVTTATLTIDDKVFKNVAAAEAISFTGANAGDFSWTLGGYANTFATNNSGVIKATATALVAGDAGDDITVDASGRSGTNAINLTLKDTAADATDAIAITITGSAGGDTLKIEEAKAASAAVISVDGGAGNDTITVTVTATHAGTVTIAGGAGDDTITGSAIADTITGGAGADKITSGEGADSVTGGTGADQIILTETTAAQDTVVIAAGDSNVDARDTVTSFAAIAGGTADKLDLVGAATIQANGTTDGSDYNTIKSHTVASGVITFDDENTFATALTVNSTNLSDVVNYLAANITGAGATVGFAYDSNSDGTNDATLIFQNNAGGDILVELVGVTGITAVAGAAGANTVLVG